MSAMSEPLPHRSMGFSLGLNVVLALGIVILLLEPAAQNSTPRLCNGDQPVVTAEVAHRGKVRYTGPADAARSGKVMREGVSSTTTSGLPLMVSYIRCQRN